MRSRLTPCRLRNRRGRDKDPAYLAWMAQQACLVSGQWPVTVHHVRRYGEPKKDRRTVPLIAERHLIQHGPQFSVEAMGRERFQQHFGVDFEGAIVRYNEMYDQALAKARRGRSDT